MLRRAYEEFAATDFSGSASDRFASHFLARQTGVEIRFIENAELLAPLGGDGAFLRYQLDSAGGRSVIDREEVL